MNPTSTSRPAFTLIELLVVISILALLASLLLPALSSARERGRRAICLSNLRQVGIAIQCYASDSEGKMPYGPKAPPFTSPSEFYPSTGAPTSLLSLRTGEPVALGLLLAQYLAAQPKVLFCPSSDQPLDAGAELAKVGTNQAASSYYYRHDGNTLLFDEPGSDRVPEHIKLDHLGQNRDGLPIRALAIDSMFLCPDDFASFNVKPRSHHRRRVADVLFADGHVSFQSNHDDRFTVDTHNYEEVREAFSKILKVFERADAEP